MSIHTPAIIVSKSQSGQESALENLLTTLSASQDSPDTLIVAPEKNTITVDQVRHLQLFLSMKPFSQKIKIVIIKSAHFLTTQAQNALLKPLEESPTHSQIILTTTDESLLLPTILSRCQVIYSLSPQTALDKNETAKADQTLAALQSSSLAQKIQIASELASTRESALTILDHLLIGLHQKAINPRLIKAIFEAKKRLKTNCNVRLTLENLLLNW